MASNRREIELLISARDTTGRTFKQVSSTISDLSASIEAQVAAATRGEASLDQLRKSQQALAQAGRDLANIQGQVDGFRRLSETVSKTKDAFAQAEANLAKYKAELAATDKVTAAQERKLENLEKKVQTTSAAFDKTKASLKDMSTTLQKVGVDTANLGAAQTQIVASARDTGAAFVAVGSAIDNFADNLRLAQQAEAQLAAGGAMDRKIAEAARLGDASRFVRLYAQAVDQVHLADQQLASLNGFRAVGQQAADASRDVGRFGVEAERLKVSSSQVAAGLRGIIDPAGAALQSINGLEAAVEKADAALRTDNQSIGQYSIALNQLSEAGAAVVRQGALVDTFQNQEAAVARARNEFGKAQADVARFGTAMAQAEAPTEAMVRDLNQAQGALETTGRALQGEETRLVALQRELEAAGLDTRNLVTEQQRLAAIAGKVNAGTSFGNQKLGRNGEKGSGLFGLNPNEMQNLGFQINDIFVSLASGQKPLTVLVQQGAQIAQIFPGLISTVGRFALAWAPVAVAVGAAGFAITDTIGKMNALQQATATVNLRGLTDFNPSSLTSASEALEKVGLSAEDAQKQIKAVLDATSDETAFAAIIVNATALAEKLGIAVPDAIKLQIDAFTGGIEATEKLAAETNLLSESEVRHAEELFRTGQSAEAHKYIQESLTSALQAQANMSDGVLSPAIRNLQTAWDNFTGFLSKVFKPVIDEINQYIQNTIVGFTFLTGLMAGKTGQQAADEARAAVVPKVNGGRPGGNFDQQDARDAASRRRREEELLNNRKDLTREQRIQIAGQKEMNRAQAEGVSQGEAQLRVDQARRLERRKIKDEDDRAAKSAASRGRAEANRAAAAARRVQRQQESGSEKLLNQLASMSGTAAKGSTADLEQRLDAIDQKYRKVYETISKLRALGVNAAGGRTLDQIEADAKALQEQIKVTETLKFYEEQINALTSQRKSEIDLITTAQRTGSLTTQQAYEAALEVQNRLNAGVKKNAQEALAVANKALKALQDAGKAVPPELFAQIADATNTIGQVEGDQTANNVASSASTADEQYLNQLLTDRNALVAEWQQRVELGYTTDSVATAAMRQGWERAAPQIEAVTQKIRDNLDLLKELKDEQGRPLISESAYQATVVRLNTINHQLKFTDQNLLKVRQAGEQAFAQGFVNVIQSVADGFGGLIMGTKSWGDALNGVLNAGLALVGQFTQAIGQAIIQLMAMRIAKQLLSGGLGIFHDGGIVGSSGGRTRKDTGGELAWAVAPRFHTGGGMGLKRDEYRAVLQRGEEVLTADDPRHIRNLGKGGGGGNEQPGSFKQVLLLDPEEVPRAMQSKSGERALLTLIKANKPTIKQMLS